MGRSNQEAGKSRRPNRFISPRVESRLMVAFRGAGPLRGAGTLSGHGVPKITIADFQLSVRASCVLAFRSAMQENGPKLRSRLGVAERSFGVKFVR